MTITSLTDSPVRESCTGMELRGVLPVTGLILGEGMKSSAIR